MARFLSQTLIRRCSSSILSSKTNDGVRLISSRKHSTQPESSFQVVDSSSLSELEALTVRKIEDAIHHIIVKRSTPDWLPFVPGASYWVPPKRRNFGIAEIVHKLAVANALSQEEVMSLTTAFGWPSSDFYIQGMLRIFLRIFVCLLHTI